MVSGETIKGMNPGRAKDWTLIMKGTRATESIRTGNPDMERVLMPYRASTKVVGIVLVGSSSQSYRDALSDYDLEIIVCDSHYATLNDDAKLTLHQVGSVMADCLMLPERDFLAKQRSPADIDHWPYEECVVLHDPLGFLDRELPMVIAMPAEVRESRIKLHYFEFLFAARRMGDTLLRGDELNARLVASQSVLAAVKLAFVLRHHWPPVTHWISQNLARLERVPPRIRLLLLEILKQPNTAVADNLVRKVDRMLEEENLPYSIGKNALAVEVTGPRFRLVRERYGSL